MMGWHGFSWPLSRSCLVLAAAMCLSAAARAQSPRDPTQAPASAGVAGAPGQPGPAPAENPSISVIVRDGRPYLVVGSRLLAQGQKLGTARIERIGETEIWLREGRVLRKVARFSGVQRSPASRIQP